MEGQERKGGANGQSSWLRAGSFELVVEGRRFLQAQGLRFGMMVRLVVETFQGVGREGGRGKWKGKVAFL